MPRLTGMAYVQRETSEFFGGFFMIAERRIWNRLYYRVHVWKNIDIPENTSIIESRGLIDDRNYAPRSLSHEMEGTARLPDQSLFIAVWCIIRAKRRLHRESCLCVKVGQGTRID